MFSCIYFLEDASLSVVGLNDKNLEKLGEFKSGEKVRMKWGKKTFHGIIIKVGDDEEALNQFATRAHSKILKHIEEKPTEPPAELFTFCIDKNGNTNYEKRERKKTKRVQESEEQETEFSPKKKNKKVKLLKSSTSIETTSLPKKSGVGDDIVIKTNHTSLLSSIMDQFTQDPVKQTETAHASERMSFSGSDQFPVSNTEMLQSKSPVKMTDVWRVCSEAMNATQETFWDHTPEPEAEVALCEAPTHLGSNFTRDTGSSPQPFNIEDKQKTSEHSLPVLDQDFLIFLQLLLKPNVQACARDLLNFARGLNVEKTGNIEHQCHTPVVAIRRSPRKTKSNTQITNLDGQESFVSPTKSASYKSLASTSFEDNQQDKSVPAEKYPSVASTPTADQGRHILISSYPSVTADTAKVAKACAAASKAPKPGYKLCYNLLQAVFTVEELAQSRGQGLLKIKDGEHRLPLDKTRISAIKDYARRWCRKQEKPAPTESELNNAITEQVSFCRKKLKRDLS